jgi:hypothetical protein
MSKSVTRIVFSALIALGVIAGVYTSVRGAASNAGELRGQAHVTAGLLPDLSHQRRAIQKLQIYMPQGEGTGHHCRDEGMNPNDD